MMSIIPRRYFIPYEHADFVGGLEIGRVRDFDVATQQVQAQTFSFDHHVAHVLLGWRRVDRFWVEILIERRPHVKRLAIEEQFSIARFEAAKTKAIPKNIDRGIAQARFDRIQHWMIRTPETGGIDAALETFGARPFDRYSFRELSTTSFVANHDGQWERMAGHVLGTTHAHVGLDLAINMGCDVHAFDVQRRSKLK